MARIALLLQQARVDAGFSQSELAALTATSQSAIARFESGEGNPTVDTVCRYAAAIGVDIHVDVVPSRPRDAVVERYKADVDRTLLRQNLRKSVSERIRSLAEWQEDMRELQRATRAARGASQKRASVASRGK